MRLAQSTVTTKRTLAFILALFAMITVLSGSLLAQTKVGWGVKGGISLASFHDVDPRYEIDVDKRAGIGIGGFLIVNVNDHLVFQPELLFVQKGGKESWSYYEIGYSGSRYNESQLVYKLDYLEVPVLVKIRIPQVSGMKPSLYVGPTLAIKVSAKGEFESSFFDSTGVVVEHSSWNKDVGSFFKDTDFGLTLGGDLAMDAKFAKIILDARYFLGLTGIDEPKVEPESKVGTTLQSDIKNKVISFTIGFVFPLSL